MRLISYLLTPKTDDEFPHPYLLTPELATYQLWIAIRHAADVGAW